MKKLFSLSALCALFISVAGLATPAYAGKFNLSAGIGIEYMKYEEHFPEDALTPFPVDSDAEVINTVASAVAEYTFNNKFFLGAKGAIPVGKGDDTEEWEEAGFLFQTNDLEYGWTRADAYAGYTFAFQGEDVIANEFSPFIGIRSSWAKQERSNFVVVGVPTPGLTATEKINSYGTILGFKAVNSLFDQKLVIGTNFEWVFPFDVEVTNTAIPGMEINAKKGYTWKLGISGAYILSERWSIGSELYGGRMHWKGSDWVPYGIGFVKWPSNDTTYFGGNASLTYKF